MTSDPAAVTSTAVPAVEVRGVRKTYGTVQALVGVDLTLRPGTVHGLVGEQLRLVSRAARAATHPPGVPLRNGTSLLGRSPRLGERLARQFHAALSGLLAPILRTAVVIHARPPLPGHGTGPPAAHRGCPQPPPH